MKMQLLYEFITLSELLNFTKAAQRMNVTQPVLSRHMKYLEEQFGDLLFLRDTHNVELTSTGKLLANEAQKIIYQYEKSISTIHQFTGKSHQKLTITFLGEAIQSTLIPFLNYFQKQFPHITVDTCDSELEDALTLLDRGQCDLGFLIRPNFLENNKFQSYTFKTDSIGVAVNKNHPLALTKEAAVSLRDVSQWPVIRINPQAFFLSEAYSTQFFDHYQIPYILDKEYPNLKTCCFNLEFRDKVVLLMPKHRKYLLGQNSVLLDIQEKDFWFNLELVWHQHNTNPCIHTFLNHFKCFLNHHTEHELIANT
ncbi:MAG: HTH-type transcriptional regulator HdfR [Candidatus Celerinatantimonas neptuna]|nr:MAG: HTH-type transcriptional regulator HdfR [Candidatus Celerinatantimonas neptuna]